MVMEDRKYILTDETKEVNGHILLRIQAVRSFGDILAGEYGGFIEKEENLSHEGNCWVYGNACVYENACIMMDARIMDYAQVYGEAYVYSYACVMHKAKVYQNAYVYGDARVLGSAQIYGHTQVYGDARIEGNTKIHGHILIRDHTCFYTGEISSPDSIFYCGPIGSRNGCTTFTHSEDDGQIYVCCGCFKGTIDEFEEKVRKTYPKPDVLHSITYTKTIEYVKTIFEARTLAQVKGDI